MDERVPQDKLGFRDVWAEMIHKENNDALTATTDDLSDKTRLGGGGLTRRWTLLISAKNPVSI